VLLYTKGGRGKGASSSAYDLSDPQLQSLIEADLWEQLQEEVELLEVRSAGGGGEGGDGGEGRRGVRGWR
jgi:hypothetical protein